MLSKEIKYLEEIKNYLDGHQTVPSDAHDKCRIILERVFKSKYHLELKSLGRASSLNDFVLKLMELGIYDQARVSEFQALIPKLHQPHHAGSSTGDSEGDVKYVLRESLGLMKKV